MTFGAGTLEDSLAGTLDRRLLDAKGEADRSGEDPLAGRCGADLKALSTFVRADVDGRRVRDLACGLSLVRIPATLGPRELVEGTVESLPASLAILVAAFSPARLLSHLSLLPAGASVSRPRRIVSLLLADRVGEAVALAWRSLRLAGMRLPSPPPDAMSTRALPGRRLAAALLFPLALPAVAALTRSLPEPPESAAATH